MINIIGRNRFLIIRRSVQLLIILAFVASSRWGWSVLKGNLSSAKVLDSFYLADPFAVLQMFFSGFVASSDLIIGALIVLLFYALVGGRAFCSWVCPLNVVTETAAWLRRKLGLDTTTDNIRIKRNIRYYVLILSLLLSFVLAYAAFEVVSPIGMLQRGLIFGFGMGWAVALSVFLFDLVVLKNGWCGHFCPLGAFYSLAGKLALVEIKHNVDNCTDCMNCFRVCPEPQILKNVTKKTSLIDSGECTNCGRCIDLCEDDALKFVLKNLKNNKNEN
ncbi:MAG: quinol dehydrogenase ferredoxin subunit NapH [Chlorobi bacterium]|nr:quinol dehydrogenase ferredoxin subunit NapH [Chlorobiota bacterium]